MYATDFVYDDKRASDYGFYICHIKSDVSDSIQMGSELEFDTVRHQGSHLDMIVNSKFSGAITTTFDIMKFSCEEDIEYEFSPSEIEFCMKWLQRKNYYIFKPIYQDNEFQNMFYYGTFNNIEAVYEGGKVIGLTLSFISNSPYGYCKLNYNGEVDSNEDINIYIESSETGFIYPTRLKIELKESGNFELTNKSIDGNTMKIKNCVTGEIIEVDCMHKIINSSNHTKIYNDFNYEWIKLINTIDDKYNLLSPSLNCKIEMEYLCPRKVGVFV